MKVGRGKCDALETKRGQALLYYIPVHLRPLIKVLGSESEA